jgi:hypothetical protein
MGMLHGHNTHAHQHRCQSTMKQFVFVGSEPHSVMGRNRCHQGCLLTGSLQGAL